MQIAQHNCMPVLCAIVARQDIPYDVHMLLDDGHHALASEGMQLF